MKGATTTETWTEGGKETKGNPAANPISGEKKAHLAENPDMRREKNASDGETRLCGGKKAHLAAKLDYAEGKKRIWRRNSISGGKKAHLTAKLDKRREKSASNGETR